MTVTQSRKGYIAEFDGMRGIAILLVMLYHFWKYNGTGAAGAGVSVAASIGWAGVDIFFVLSGFLITRILIASRDDPHYWRNFYVRRSLRIFPLYYGVMTALLIGAFIAKSAGIVIQDPSFAASDRLWINYLYLTNFARAIHGIDYVPLDIAWSLAIEEQFYLVYPLIVWWASRANLKRFLVGAIIAAPLFRLAAFHFSGGGMDGPYVLPFSRMDSLALGGLTALIIQDAPQRTRAWIAASPVWLSLAALFLLFNYTRADVQFVIFGYSMTALAAAAFVVRTFERENLFSARVLRNEFLVYIGKISYGLYLLHLFARAAIDRILPRVLPAGWQAEFGFSMLRLGLLFAAAIALATVSFYAFERPILALKDKYAPPSKSHARAAPDGVPAVVPGI